ncbi:putative disease resistance protein At1g59780 [Ricinus communis]|uniref:putative disease resistance protein At1g59780 n=1 Tax=Ricinus communis TaxID=3988 RepID=UPI00201A6CF2|nr:putative disease resistance protein At1g59780 [Ricinus communis]
MPHFYFTCNSDNIESFVAELLRKKNQDDGVLSISLDDGNRSSMSSIAANKDESDCLAALKSDYEKLPDRLKCCFEYCCISIRYSMEKGKLIRLLLAERLIQEKNGSIMEDIAASIITELIGIGMLQEEQDGSGNILQVPSLLRQLSLIKTEKQDFVTNPANLLLRLVIRDHGKGIPSSLKSLLIRSLFMVTAERCGSSSFESESGISGASMETICGFQFLLVLDVDGKIEYLPNEIGDLVHLRYLGLENSDLNELPQALGNLQKLQTLDIRMCGWLHELPIEVLRIKQLRHLLMSRSIEYGEIIVPKGIGKLVNLHTFTGVYAGGGIASELSTLTQLRELGVKRVSEDHASELYAAIMKMGNLISLSLEAEQNYCEDTDERFSLLPEFELFSPPPVLQELYIDGGLIEMPIWLASMSNLTTLNLFHSDLQEMPTSVLQFLPKLKHLTLWEAYRGKQIGKDFCQAGGFRELKTLTIASKFLVEWTEIENEAFPKLKCLSFRCCLELRFLPEGLQNISTLEELALIPMHEDLAWRLINEENYKIKHISKLRACYRQKFCGIFVGDPKDVLLSA